MVGRGGAHLGVAGVVLFSGGGVVMDERVRNLITACQQLVYGYEWLAKQYHGPEYNEYCDAYLEKAKHALLEMEGM